MTKAELEKENKRLREALEKISTLTSIKNINSIMQENKLDESNLYDRLTAYAVSMGEIDVEAKYALYVDDYILHREKYEKEADDDKRRENRPA